MIHDDPAVAELVLRSILQALALPPEEQIGLYANAPCVTCVLADLYRKWSTTFAGSREAAATTKQGQQAMERLAAAVRITSYPAWSTAHPCGDSTRLHSSEYFSAVRRAAREALCEYGWSVERPALEFLPGTAEHGSRLDTVQAEREQQQQAKRRSKKARLKFHRVVFDELRITPVASSENVAILKRRERELGIKFPRAVFEWFSLEGVTALFRERTNQDEMVDDAYDEWDKLERLGDEESIRQRYLMVAVENQGVVRWYVRLDGSEDPPVFHDNDTFSEDLNNVDWVACATTFSEFIHRMVTIGNDGVGLQL